MTCLVSASGCGAHFCYLCGSDWDQSAYKCTNSSCASGGRSGDIYSTNTDGVTTSEFDRLNEECAGHLAALRASQSIATNLSFDPLIFAILTKALLTYNMKFESNKTK